MGAGKKEVYHYEDTCMSHKYIQLPLVREDEGHVFNVIVSTCVYCEFKVHIYCVIQRIGGHTIMGGPEQLQVQRFCEASLCPFHWTNLLSINSPKTVNR